ncbi:MAG: hypothetical protein V1656_02885 [Candidatus Jorgensenbacteria bacterium]
MRRQVHICLKSYEMMNLLGNERTDSGIELAYMVNRILATASFHAHVSSERDDPVVSVTSPATTIPKKRKLESRQIKTECVVARRGRNGTAEAEEHAPSVFWSGC